MMNAHHVDLPLSFGAYMTFSPSCRLSVSFSSFPKDAVSLLIFMLCDLLHVVERGEPPAGGLLYAAALLVVARRVVS